ncbi:hypothetical protein GALMADRAFT_65988 [Galerina marginata CBS 339.88]|uniref:Uncharacterized protein n=1 Tax=Galerina marginata (strain CBS 339.88) TaxID=685588 RepID=A0A067T5I2_GALM3|nr:hypothetical protein GALMADRAFT_65988 [Galerina marginata CBS 339.88]
MNNLEKAIAQVLRENQVPNYANVFSAYTSICHPRAVIPPAGAVLAFERATGKYPASEDKVRSPYATYVADIRREYWQQSIDLLLSMFPSTRLYDCPCCGDTLTADDMRRKLGLMIGITPPAKEVTSKKIKSSRAAKKPKTKKLGRNTLVFDPYGPSTSARSL